MSPSSALVLFLSPYLAGAAAVDGAAVAHADALSCPPEPEVRRVLGVEGAAGIDCLVADQTVYLAAVVPPAGTGDAPARVVVSTAQNQLKLRGVADLGGAEAEQIARIAADDWTVRVAPAPFAGTGWVEVDAVGVGGEDLVISQVVVSYFTGDGKNLRPLWTGLGDRHERRFDVCRIDSPASFTLSSDGDLVRSRHSTRAFKAPSGIDPDLVTTIEAECVAPPSTKDTFALVDDGVDADAPVSDKLRARARENRKLFWRATRSPKDLARFVADSGDLVQALEDEIASTAPGDPEAGDWGIRATGALAEVVAGARRAGLDWNKMAIAAGPQGQRLVRAIEELGGGRGRGAWSERSPTAGGSRTTVCHRPEAAEPVLRRLVEAWAATPAPTREAFRPPVAKALAAMAEQNCFCAGAAKREEIQKALGRNAAILEGLRDLGAPAARKLRALLGRAGTRFDCSAG